MLFQRVLCLIFIHKCVISTNIDGILETSLISVLEYEEDMLILGLKPPLLMTKSNVKLPEHYWTKLVHKSRQNVLKLIAKHIIITNNEDFKPNIRLNLSATTLTAKYFWYSYVALSNYLDMFIDIWGITYDKNENSIVVQCPFRQRYFEADYIPHISIKRHGGFIHLEIHANFVEELRLNHVGFINDPWDGIHIELFRSFRYNQTNEILFMQNMKKWKLSPKWEFVLNGLSCSIINNPCSFGFINRIYSKLDIKIFTEINDTLPALIDISNIVFGDVLDKLNIFHSGGGTKNTVSVIVPDIPVEFIKHISLAGDIILYNTIGEMVKLSSLTQKYMNIELNPFILDFNVQEFAYQSVICYRSGIYRELIVPLIVFYHLNHKGTMDIINYRNGITIDADQFYCVKETDEGTWRSFRCSYASEYIIDIKEMNVAMRPHRRGNVREISTNCFGCLQSGQRHRQASNLIIWVYTANNVTFVNNI